MRRHHQLWAFTVAAAYANYIAFGVDGGIGKAGFFQFSDVILGARFFLEGRRGYLIDAHLFFEHAYAAALDRFQRLNHGRVPDNAFERLFDFWRYRLQAQLRGSVRTHQQH